MPAASGCCRLLLIGNPSGDAGDRTFSAKATKCGRKVLVSPKSETSAVITTNSVVPLVYSIDETALALRVSSRTIRNLLRAGQLVRRKIGSCTVIPVTSVEAFLRRDHATGEEGKRTRKKAGTK